MHNIIPKSVRKPNVPTHHHLLDAYIALTKRLARITYSIGNANLVCIIAAITAALCCPGVKAFQKSASVAFEAIACDAGIKRTTASNGNSLTNRPY